MRAQSTSSPSMAVLGAAGTEKPGSEFPTHGSFKPETVAEQLRQARIRSAGQPEYNPLIAALRELDSSLLDASALESAQMSSELAREVFAQLLLSTEHSLDYLKALRSVVIRLNPVITVYMFPADDKKQIVTTLLHLSATDFLTGGVCFEILNSMYFALDYTSVTPVAVQASAVHQASITFEQAADCIEMTTTLLPSIPSPSHAASKAAKSGLSAARDAARESLFFILSSKENLLGALPNMLTAIGRRLLEQPSLGFALHDDIFDELEGASNEKHIFNAMLEHELLACYIRRLAHTVACLGRNCAERFTLERLIIHSSRLFRTSAGLDSDESRVHEQ